MDLSLAGNDRLIFWDAIEFEVEFEFEFCRKTGNLPGYLVGAFRSRLVLLIVEWLVFASTLCLCTRRHSCPAGKCKRALCFLVMPFCSDS